MSSTSQVRRSLMKGVSWETIAFIITMFVTYLYLKSFSESLWLTSILFFIKIGFFFGHERLWHRIKWGKVARNTHV